MNNQKPSFTREETFNVNSNPYTIVKTKRNLDEFSLVAQDIVMNSFIPGQANFNPFSSEDLSKAYDQAKNKIEQTKNSVGQKIDQAQDWGAQKVDETIDWGKSKARAATDWTKDQGSKALNRIQKGAERATMPYKVMSAVATVAVTHYKPKVKQATQSAVQNVKKTIKSDVELNLNHPIAHQAIHGNGMALTLLLVNPKMARVVENEMPVVTALNFEGSGYNGSASSSINLWNGQKFAGVGGGLQGNTKSKALDVKPSGGVSLTMVPRKHLKTEAGVITVKSVSEKTDGILEGASVGGSATFRGVLVGAEYNFANPGEEGKIVYKLGISGKSPGVDFGVGTSGSVKVGDPMWRK